MPWRDILLSVHEGAVFPATSVRFTAEREHVHHTRQGACLFLQMWLRQPVPAFATATAQRLPRAPLQGAVAGVSPTESCRAPWPKCGHRNDAADARAVSLRRLYRPHQARLTHLPDVLRAQALERAGVLCKPPCDLQVHADRLMDGSAAQRRLDIRGRFFSFL
jgi:hypothetical protein